MKLNPPHLWTNPVWGAYSPRADLALSGLERMRRFVHEDASQPPISGYTGMSIGEIGTGSVEFALPVSPWFLAATGGVPGSVLALAADGALGCSLMTLLEPGQLLTTSELSMSYLRPVKQGTKRVVARAHSVHATKTLGLSEVAVHDDLGRLLARGSSRCVFIPAPKHWAPPPIGDRPPGALTAHEHAVVGETSENVFAADSYINLLERWRRNELPAPPLCNFFGLRPVEHEAGSTTWDLPASPWFNNVAGVMYGGVLAMLADSAIAGAVWSTMEQGQALASLNLHMYFFRPVLADGRALRAKGSVVRSGRSLRMAAAEVFDADGGLVAAATGSAKVVSDRAPSLSHS